MKSKKRVLILIGLIMIVFTSLLAKNYNNIFYRGPFISVKDAEKRWGRTDFDAEKWRKANISDRAKMASSIIISKKNFIGKTNLEIKEIFGPHDSYYVNDPIPAYTIQSNTTSGGERWDLVFLIDQNNKVFDIKIHRQYP
jgi:hypothetical protein